MTNQEAIETLKEIVFVIDGDTHFHFECIEAIDVAIEALEKQTPKKVIREDIEVAELDYCPNCKVRFFTKYGMAYCSACGQKIDWSE